MFNTSKMIITAAILTAISASTASAASIERAGGAKVLGEPSWVAAVTYISDEGERIKITTEKDAAGRDLQAGDGFDRVVIAPTGAYSISNPYSVVAYVKSELGAGYVDVIKSNGEEEKDHW